jgi:hypothetical protein
VKCALHLSVRGARGTVPSAVTVAAGWAVCADCAGSIMPWLSASANERAVLARVTELGRGRP